MDDWIEPVSVFNPAGYKNIKSVINCLNVLFTWFEQMENAYLKEFQKVYQEKGKYDLTAQIPYLARLAEDYEQRYLRSGNWMDCLKVGS